jgi:hypothetical protein
MASDQVVVAQDVLRALMELRRLGTRPALEDLEKLEPDLSEFLLEELTGIHHDLLHLGASAPRARRLSRRVETLALVVVHALRHAHLRLWGDQAAGTPLALLNSSADGPAATADLSGPREEGDDGPSEPRPGDGL